MKKSIGRFCSRAVALVAVIAVLGIVIGQAASAHDNDEAKVRDVLAKSALSFEKNDCRMAAEVWANDESLTVFEQGHANYGWAGYRDNHLFPEMGEMKNTKYSLSDIRVHLAAKTAWATFKYAISGDVTEEGRTRHAEGGGLGTAVLEEQQGRWRIVHWHSSAPRCAPAPSASPVKKD
jgi:ketosteroid isomerase-like protein